MAVLGKPHTDIRRTGVTSSPEGYAAQGGHPGSSEQNGVGAASSVASIASATEGARGLEVTESGMRPHTRKSVV
jgi:hypothetical protein